MSKPRALNQWFATSQRVLPWRSEPTLYRVWISEIMLQQTQVVTVVPYFERFLRKFPSVELLAAVDEADVLALWAGLGYYSRARNLRRAAQQIVAAGDFPRDREGWEALPGVGPYTAGAILSIALDLPEAILDGNVERVLSRVHRVDRAAGDAAYKSALWDHSRELVAVAAHEGVKPSVLNQALMELGAVICTPRSPRCGECPIAADCEARRGGVQAEYPPRKARKAWVDVREEVHCWISDDAVGVPRVLLRRRAEGEWRAGLWDFPEAAPAAGALPREVGQVQTRHVVTRHRIQRTTHIWNLARPPRGQADRRWVSLERPEVPVGAALRVSLEEVRRALPGEWPLLQAAERRS